ncbi:hypothetical protein EMIHUDRAFT_256926 [Emiliania huxleyi CCMP1516]|uniref:Uncharacterized protein n=2 Tax=Emiliania huxleyi TaxID=2903 RepID=A0A0D3IPQ9_EMIH1|nr:hypothetical protein EMIHUDRAFT_256926 [Emiliania huxleyi CCMP1516]EOD13244.1 hypothetical protein EMIHUDRAFT_256926 [Emiliania huxleyi CCMP1516]|eukprot:XP_005765673.1 hypothetical protein EMIHUDRAFT_256926 [Emiliania huxleyi CCMP1516]
MTLKEQQNWPQEFWLRANAWVAELASVANCASVATRSGHERRANLHFELAWQPPSARGIQTAEPARQPADFPHRSAHVRPRVYGAYTRGRTCSASTAASRSLEGGSSSATAAEPGQRGRGWDRERRSRSESPSDGKAGRRGATAVERRLASKKRRLRAPHFE